MSKGSGRRPLGISEEEFNERWDRIFKKGYSEEDSCESREHQDKQQTGDQTASPDLQDKQGES